MKYRKKPVVIEAVQWDGRNLEEIKEFVRQITRKRKVEKVLSNNVAVYVLYADGTWRKKEK